MSLASFARDEMQRAGLFDKDSDYGGMLGDSVMKMIDAFAGEGHSGFSANLAISIFEKVARFQPLTPLTGDDDEWNDIAEQNGGPLFQNKRCATVFKDPTGAYDMDGRIFREPSGACFTSRDSRVAVTFPYTPAREYVDVPASS